MKTPHKLRPYNSRSSRLSRLVQSLFRLAGTLKQHVETYVFSSESKGGNYVDDVIIGKDTVDQVHGLKGGAMSVF